MKRLLTGFCAAAVLATGMISASAPAAADDYYRDGYRHHRGYDRGNNDALAAGVIGLGVGAIIGGALAGSNEPTYYESRPRYRVYDEEPVYYGRRTYEVERPVRYAPRYREVPVYRQVYDHTSACEARYRSYDRRSDTFVGYDGRLHRCRL